MVVAGQEPLRRNKLTEERMVLRKSTVRGTVFDEFGIDTLK